MFVALFYAIENWRGNRAWQRYLASSESRGDQNQANKFVRPAVSNELNFAKTPLLERSVYKGRSDSQFMAKIDAAVALVDDDSIGDFQKGTWTCFDCADVGTLAPTSESIQGARRVLAGYQTMAPETEELRRAARRPYAQFEADEGPFAEALNFVFLRNLTRVFSSRVLAELISGDVASAADDLEVLHKIADGLRDHPTLVGAMIRCAILGVKQPFYEGWARRQWTEAQYEHFQNYYAGVNVLQNVDGSICGGERVGLRELVLRRRGKELEDIFNFAVGAEKSGSLEARIKRACVRFMPRGWWQQNLVVHHRIVDRALEIVYERNAHRVNAPACDKVGAEIERELMAARPFHFLAAVAIPNLGRAFKKAAEIEIINQQASLVCALERFRIRHGSYPQTLGDLVPELASDLPKSPISGQIPFYERQADGKFVLFTRGWPSPFGVTDAEPTEPDAEDIVWPFPPRPGKILGH